MTLDLDQVGATANDATTPLANIAALTAADRGLSLGEADIPTNRALTVAEMTQTNADSVGIPLDGMLALFTNHAAEVVAPGVMNTDGTLGYYSKGVANIIDIVVENGATVLIDITLGPFVLPNGTYIGQMINIATSGAGATGVINGRFRGRLRNSAGVYAAIPGGAAVDTVWKAREHTSCRWNGTDWQVLSFNHLPDFDLFTNVANVAILTDAQRGLSLGTVAILTNRALTMAEISQANAQAVSISLRDEVATYTNKAIATESALGATGVMNTNGQLGHQTRLFFATAANFATMVQTALDNNGAHLSVDFTGGETIVMPAARYAGQMLTLRFNASSTSKELIINKTGITWAGMIRDSQHRIRPSAPADNFLIVRPGEEIQLYGLGAGTPGWRVAPFEMSMLSGTTWVERHDGKVDINTAVVFATNTPAGQTLAQTFMLPITIADFSGATFHMTDVTSGAVALGLSASIAGNASAIYGEHQPQRTPTSLRLLARNTLAVAANPGAVALSILAAKPNYLALGGVASF